LARRGPECQTHRMDDAPVLLPDAALAVRRIVIMGPPASGKGTQGQRLAGALGVPHVSSGQLLRRSMEQGDPFGIRAFVMEGDRVPDEIVEAVLVPALGPGFLLDGYPRTEHQAARLDDLLAPWGHAIEVVVELLADETELRARMEGRAEEEHRSDDRPAVFERRLEDYRRQADAIRSHYRDRLVPVQAMGSEDAVFALVLDALGAAEPAPVAPER
jgi:adenylate kinase